MKLYGVKGRNWLKSTMSDAIHAILCAAGQDLFMLLQAIAIFFASIRGVLWNVTSRCNRSRRTHRTTTRHTPSRLCA